MRSSGWIASAGGFSAMTGIGIGGREPSPHLHLGRTKVEGVALYGLIGSRGNRLREDEPQGIMTHLKVAHGLSTGDATAVVTVLHGPLRSSTCPPGMARLFISSRPNVHAALCRKSPQPLMLNCKQESEG